MNDMGVLPTFAGTAVHDAWAPYDTYTAAEHALCNSHVLRELQAVTDHHETTADPTTWCWAAQVHRPPPWPATPRSSISSADCLRSTRFEVDEDRAGRRHAAC
jgi:hypothetical protein